MLTIDGSYGEGGGQILRTALGLAAIVGTPMRIDNIRARREKPGLQKQHLCAVRAIRDICQGELDGDQLGSRTLAFQPSSIVGGHHEFHIGTAGSTSLVAQAALIPLLRAAEPSHLLIHGGTHNPLAPPVDFLQRVYLPVLQQMGIAIRAELIRYGLYPKGGGSFAVSLEPPTDLRGFQLTDRGKLVSATVWALVAGLPKHIADREVNLIRRRNPWPHCQTYSIEIDNDTGPGNLVMIELEFEHSREIVTEFGQRGVRAEQVAKGALRQAKSAVKSAVPVGQHLADQLLLPAAIAARYHGATSRYVTGEPSLHTETHVWLLEQLLSVQVEMSETVEGNRLVEIRP